MIAEALKSTSPTVQLRSVEEYVTDGTTKTYAGIDITFSATDDGGEGYAYFDLVPENGGLGVCKTATDSCGGDDNLGIGETVTLMFETVAEISGLLFTDVDHDPVVGTNYLTINDVYMTFDQAAAMIFTVDTLKFGFSEKSGQAYYINGLTAVVPIPAAGFLLLGGLGGLAALRRRKKAA